MTIRQRYIFVTAICILSVGPPAACANGQQTAGKKCLPNVVIIFTDDQGYADVGVFGAKKIKTPNLDRMAKQGVRFTDFYVSTAVCSASRSALLTGCYHARVGLHGALSPQAKIGLNPNETTIAEMLKQLGYRCGCFASTSAQTPAIAFDRRHQGHRKRTGSNAIDQALYKTSRAIHREEQEPSVLLLFGAFDAARAFVRIGQVQR